MKVIRRKLVKDERLAEGFLAIAVPLGMNSSCTIALGPEISLMHQCIYYMYIGTLIVESITVHIR